VEQTFAQPNESVKILVTDAIEDLQNNDTNSAYLPADYFLFRLEKIP
jgi:hypothetical protein